MAYGTVNADVIGTSVAGSNLGAGNATAFKNRIINGAMVIDQRGPGTYTPNNSYTLDRWQFQNSQTAKVTIAQNQGSVTPPTGYINYLGITSSSAYSVTSTDYFMLAQKIEGLNVSDLGWGTANAKTITLSFQVYSSLTGTFGGSLVNQSGARSYPFTYTISSANTWTSVSVTIAGDTSGTWLTTNGIGINVYFSMGAGSTVIGTAGTWASAAYYGATGQTSVVGTNGATFYITGVQLEVGSSATGFDFRSIGTELALCQRYYINMNNPSGSGLGIFGAGYIDGTTQGRAYTALKVTMRASPTVTGTNLYIQNNLVVGPQTSFSTYKATPDAIAYIVTSAGAGLTGNSGCIITDNSSASASITASAEL